MKYCSQCLTTSLRPNAKFIGNVCIACHYAATSDLRVEVVFRQLKELLRSIKRKKNQDYDCIVGVSGGKDSLRQAIWVRDRLNFKPLLVSVAYPPKQLSDIGAQNISNMINHDFDIVQVSPAPLTSCELSLQSFVKFGNVCKSTEMALFSCVPKIAIELGIRLIFWGENPALQVGDSATSGQSPLDGNNLRKLNTLADGGDQWMELKDPYKKSSYSYPSESEFLKNDTQIIYLGAVWDDWSTFLNSTLGALSGLILRPNQQNVTGDYSEASMLDEEFTNINMMLKYYKYGFGRATDQMNELIRSGTISRCEAIELVKNLDGKCDDTIINSYCSYVGISKQRFWDIAYEYVNWDLFKLGNAERPLPMFEVGVGLND
jgi:N-acetyl sugar amidotransferase